jgi:hypothetical protein
MARRRFLEDHLLVSMLASCSLLERLTVVERECQGCALAGPRFLTVC